LTAKREGLLRDVRGAAMYIEFLLVVPLLAILWMANHHMHMLGASHTQVQRQARQCAWVQATGGCQGAAPAGCTLEGPTRFASQEVEQLTATDPEAAVRPINGLPELVRSQRPPGDQIVARTNATVTSPLRSELELNGFHTMACNERAPQIDQARVLDTTCRGLLGQGGRCP
jgi:hypothetical protein